MNEPPANQTNDKSTPEETDKPKVPSAVADIMTRNVLTLSPHHTFGEAVQLMSNSPFRHFPLVHADGRLAGVFSDRDVLRPLGRTHSWQAKAVSGVMTHNVLIVCRTLSSRLFGRQNLLPSWQSTATDCRYVKLYLAS